MALKKLLSFSAAVVVLGSLTGLLLTKYNTAQASVNPPAYGQLESKYGIHFTPAKSGGSNSSVISKQQALSIAEKQFSVKSSQIDVTLGYLTNINPNGTEVFVAPSTSAYKINHGKVSNYPVWLVRVSGLDLKPHGGYSPNSKASTHNVPHNNQIDEFLDASNGQMLFAVGIKQ